MNLVFDSSSLISMSQSCLIKILKSLKEDLGCRFVVPKSVHYEVVERPMNIKRFELNAVRIENAVKEGWLEVVELEQEYSALTEGIEESANSLLFIKNKPIKIIQRGEAEALALVKQLGSAVFVIDERTMRTMLEEPRNIKKLIERRMHRKVRFEEKNARALKQMFPGLEIVRSIELVALAFERNLFKEELPESKQALEAALYAAKYAGCAVSGNEIEEFLSGR